MGICYQVSNKNELRCVLMLKLSIIWSYLGSWLSRTLEKTEWDPGRAKETGPEMLSS